MTTYYADFINQTPNTWTMAVYQTLPNSVGLDSVSWKQTTVPRSGKSGVKWDIVYNVAVASYDQSGGKGVYSSLQVLPAELGSSWQVIFKDNVQQLDHVGSSSNPEQIEIANKSGLLASPGIGMSGEGSVYKHNILDGTSAQFVVTPTYFIGLFNQLEVGEIISSNVSIGPYMIKFPDGLNKVTLTASVEGGTHIDIKMDYSMYSRFSLEQVQQRITFLSHRDYSPALK